MLPCSSGTVLPPQLHDRGHGRTLRCCSVVPPATSGSVLKRCCYSVEGPSGMRCPLVIAPNQPYKVAGSAARLFTWQHRAHEDRHRPTNQSRTMQMQAKSDISRTHRYAKCQAHSSLTTSVYFGTFANRSSSASMPIRQIFVAVITREHLESNCFLSFMAQACLM